MTTLNQTASALLDHVRSVGSTTATTPELGEVVGRKSAAVKVALRTLELGGLIDIDLAPRRGPDATTSGRRITARPQAA